VHGETGLVGHVTTDVIGGTLSRLALSRMKSLCRRFVEKNPVSWTQVMTTDVDDEEHFNGFVCYFKAQVLHIVRSGVQVFTCDAWFIKSELNVLHGWSLCNLCSRDSNANLVCLTSCQKSRCDSQLPVITGSCSI
jgi:hypothetical protein